MDKLVKALEALKVMQPLNTHEEMNLQTISRKKELATTKKDKLAHASTIADSICLKSFRSNPDFLKYLGIAMETFLWCCDDEDSDVRLMADECLNRTIKTLMDTHLSRLQVELFKEIKKDGQARSLRAALSRFADLAHLIRPQKCRPYCYNLVPCLATVARRPQEAVQETLAIALAKILPVLGPVATEAELRILLDALLTNLRHPLAAIRRTAATALVTVCQHSRQPPVLIQWLLSELLGQMLPFQPGQPMPVILGVLLCFRHLSPHLASANVPLQHLLQMYELEVHFAQHSDHNVATAALEALQSLLRHPPQSLLACLKSPTGLGVSLLQSKPLQSSSGSALNLSPSGPSEDALVDENETTDLDQSIHDSQTSEDTLRTSDSLNGGDPDQFLAYDRRGLPDTNGLALNHTLKKGASDERLLGAEEDSEGFWEASSTPSPGLAAGVAVGPIGGFTDADVPLHYLGRLLCANFLLGGQPNVLLADRVVRVSVKSLAVNCLAGVVALQPSTFFLPLHTLPACQQHISDVAQFTSHPDPHLCGSTALLLGCLVEAALHHCPHWPYQSQLSLELVLDKMCQVMGGSAVSSKQGLAAARHCLRSLLQSSEAPLAPKLLDSLLGLQADNYWLVRVELAKALGELPYLLVHYTAGNTEVQNRALIALMDCLGDGDHRVRHAAAQALCKAVPLLFYPQDHPYQDSVVALAAEFSLHCLGPSFVVPHPPEGTLSRLTTLLARNLLTAASKDRILGCCEALQRLADAYPPVSHPRPWLLLCRGPTSVASAGHHQASTSGEEAGGAELLSHLVSLVTGSPYLLDLQFHQHVLPLISNLLSGACAHLTPMAGDSEPPTDLPAEGWSLVHTRHLVPLVEALYQHIFRLLNIFAHVLEEQTPLHSNPRVLPTAPSLSPIRRKSKFGGPKEESGSSTPTTPSGGGGAQENLGEESAKKAANPKHVPGLGQFHTSPLYLKLWEILRGSHASYKISMETGEKLSGLLRAALQVLSKLLELASFTDVVRSSGELLGYLKVAMGLEPPPAIECIRQLLRALFGSRMEAPPPEERGGAAVPGHATRLRPPPGPPGLYSLCLTQPGDLLAAQIKAVPEEHPELRQRPRRPITATRASTRPDKISLASHIRLFEGVVIKALKLYTVASDARLQCHVLELLAELVHLRVNYCLLDADQVFITFVVRQVDSLEEAAAHLPPVVDGLIPRIFEFLVLLSYEKYHSKPIIGVPKVLQLCDGLLATGQPPEYYAIPALQPVVEDLFLVRQLGRVDRELETQREVVVSMLLRLLAYPQVLELLALILGQCQREGEEKWRKLSRQVVDSLLPLLVRQQLWLDSPVHMETLHNLFATVSPSVFRPVDILLKAFFTPPHTPLGEVGLGRWLGMVLAIVRVLLMQTKEEVVLSRLSDLPELSPATLDTDPSPEHRLLQLLFSAVTQAAQGLALQPTAFLPQQLGQLLLYLTHMFQAGAWRQVALQAMALARTQHPCVATATEAFSGLEQAWPTLCLQWANLLTVLNADHLSYWQPLLQQLSSGSVPCHLEMLRRGGIILLCDYMCENMAEVVEQFTWLLVNHIQDLVRLSHEEPVAHFISAVHRNPAASGLLIQAIFTRCDDFSKAGFVHRCLRCLEGAHSSQSGPLLSLLAKKFLGRPQLALARRAETLACARLEGLSEDELAPLHNNHVMTRHPRLAALLSAKSPLPSAAVTHPLQLDKDWYLRVVKASLAPSSQCAQLLRALPYEDLLAVLQDKELHPLVLKHCIQLGEGPLRQAAVEVLVQRLGEGREMVPVLVAQLEAGEVPLGLVQPLAHFTIEATQGMWQLPEEEVCQVLTLLSLVLHEPGLSAVLGLSVAWTCLATDNLHRLLLHRRGTTSGGLPEAPFPDHLVKNPSESHHSAQAACSQMSQMISWLELEPKPDLPKFLEVPLKSCIIGCARLPLVNGFGRTPPELWKLGWQPAELGGELQTIPPPPPGEYLQERDVLTQYIFRINLLGWTSRQQFEETWMSLLGVLSATPLAESAEGGEEDQERVRCSCLAVKSITSLLLGTLLEPQPGNPHNSTYLHHPRDRPLPFLSSQWGKKFLDLRHIIQHKIHELLQLEEPSDTNIERASYPHDYGFGQVSLGYLRAAVGSESPGDGPNQGSVGHQLREERLLAAGLDIHSCLHFLLDLYSQWLAPLACCRTPISLLAEVVRSVVVLSDLFMERSQHEWMLDTLLELQRIHPVEDEVVSQYLILALCKAAALLGMEQELLVQLRKLVEISLQSGFLGTRVASLHGLLYLLQHNEAAPLLSVATDYLERHLVTVDLSKCGVHLEEHILAMWALSFYLMEHLIVDDSPTFQALLQTAAQWCGMPEQLVPTPVYLCILRGLQRLLLGQRLGPKSADTVLKVTAARLVQGSPPRALAALEVMFAAMYLQKGSHTWGADSNPDHMLAGLEKVSALFDRIKSGLPFEADLICQVLPNFLLDFFPLQDVLNKVIGEFLARPHPQLLARVIFQVFEHVRNSGDPEGSKLLKEWVLLSLSNFAQKSPLSTAVWSLTCFFVSASSNPWLHSLFPLVQARFGHKLEECDEEIFVAAGLDFSSQLDAEETKLLRAGLETTTPPPSPMLRLLSLL